MSIAVYPCIADIRTKEYEPVDGFDIDDAVTIPSFFPCGVTYLSYAAFRDMICKALRTSVDTQYAEHTGYIALKCARLLELEKKAKMLGATGFYIA